MNRIDLEELRQANPIELLIKDYGTHLRRSGVTFIGRCPLHQDGGRPNLTVYPSTESWFCWVCSKGGDIYTWVQEVEHVAFGEAVDRIAARTAWRTKPLRRPHAPRRAPRDCVGPAERDCLAVAADLYHRRLLTEPRALTYLSVRGIEPSTIEKFRIGYAADGELVDYLRWRRLPLQAAGRIGLLRASGEDASLAGWCSPRSGTASRSG